MAIYSDLNYIKPSLNAEYLIYDIDSVFQSIFAIIGTKRGERVFRPNFGFNLNRYLFEPCDNVTARSILYDLTNVMSLEPRVSFNTSRSTVTPVPEQKLFLLSLYFSILGFNNFEKSLNLVLSQKERKN